MLVLTFNRLVSDGHESACITSIVAVTLSRIAGLPGRLIVAESDCDLFVNISSAARQIVVRIVNYEVVHYDTLTFRWQLEDSSPAGVQCTGWYKDRYAGGFGTDHTAFVVVGC